MFSNFLIVAVMMGLIFSQHSLADTFVPYDDPELGGQPGYQSPSSPSGNYNGGNSCDIPQLIDAQQRWINANRNIKASLTETSITLNAFPHCVSKCMKESAGVFKCSSCNKERQGFRAQCSYPRTTTFVDDQLRGDRIAYDRRQLACDLSKNILNSDWRYKHDGFETTCNNNNIRPEQLGIMYLCVSTYYQNSRPVASFAEFVRGCNRNYPGYDQCPVRFPYVPYNGDPLPSCGGQKPVRMPGYEGDQLRFDLALRADRRSFACDLSFNNLNTDYKYKRADSKTICNSNGVPREQLGIMFFCVSYSYKSQKYASYAEYVRGCNTSRPGYNQYPESIPYNGSPSPAPGTQKSWWNPF
jgi:hypothetical protein